MRSTLIYLAIGLAGVGSLGAFWAVRGQDLAPPLLDVGGVHVAGGVQETCAIVQRQLAAKLASGPPLAQQAVKRAMHKGFQMDWPTLGEYQQALGDVLWETEDHMEGVRSFTERREPQFRGH